MDPVTNLVLQTREDVELVSFPSRKERSDPARELQSNLTQAYHDEQEKKSTKSVPRTEQRSSPRTQPQQNPAPHSSTLFSSREGEESESIAPDPEDNFPEGGLRAWLVTLSAVLALYPSFGLMVAIGVLQDYWSTHQLSAYTSRDVGWIPSVFVYLSLALGIGVGPLFDMYGPRWIALSGSAGYVVMMFLLAEVQRYWSIMLVCGVLGGVAGAMLTTTSLAVVAHWFKRRRALAQGIAMAGSSFGGLTMPLILHAAFPRFGYKWSIRILGFIFMGCFILANLLMRARLPPSRSLPPNPNASQKKRGFLDLSLFLDLKFSLLTVAVFGFEVVLFGTLGILPTYASLTPSYPSSTGFYLISLLNGSSTIGRALPGLLADKIGRFNTLLIALFLVLLCMLSLWLPLGTRCLPALYAFSALFGFGTGSWMALTPACIGQLCRAEEFGRYYGTLYFVASLATLICVPIGGELVQQVGGDVLVGFFCAVLGGAMAAFAGSRAACLGWRWRWRVFV